MNTEIEYRLIKPAEYDQLIYVWQNSGLSVRTRGRESREMILKQIEANPEFLIGAFHGNRMVGCVIASSDGRKGWINRLAVIPEYRNRGLARELIHKAEDILIESGVEIIACLILDDNPSSIKLFISEGYQDSRNVLYFRKPIKTEA